MAHGDGHGHGHGHGHDHGHGHGKVHGPGGRGVPLIQLKYYFFDQYFVKKSCPDQVSRAAPPKKKMPWSGALTTIYMVQIRARGAELRPILRAA